MIPKIIHYTWFSGDEYPEDTKRCIESWHKIMPDYEFRLWDMKSLEVIDSVFLREALQMKKWACAADVVRCYAIYNFGGIYMDTDVEVYKSFDEYLNLRAFIGKENSIHKPVLRDRSYSHFLTSHCFGAEKGHPFIKDCLDFYDNRVFIQSTNPRQPEYFRLNMILLPFVQCEIALQYGYDPHPFHQNIQHLEEGLVVYPTEYFDPAEVTKNSVCKHWAVGSWMSDPFMTVNKTGTLRHSLSKLIRNVLSKFDLILHRV